MIIEERISETKSLTKKSLKNLYLSLLQNGKSIYTYVWGGSMFPFIKSGDKLKIEPLGNRKIKVGDIIAVDIKDQLIKIKGKVAYSSAVEPKIFHTGVRFIETNEKIREIVVEMIKVFTKQKLDERLTI